MKKILKLYLCLLVSTQVFADVWVSNNTWNDSWEKRYAEWIKSDVSRDIFLQGRYSIKTDCADAAYSLRAIFAYENKLPFVIRNPNKYRSSYSNLTKNLIVTLVKITDDLKNFYAGYMVSQALRQLEMIPTRPLSVGKISGGKSIY